MRRTLSLRRELAGLIADSSPGTFEIPSVEPESLVAYVRRDASRWLAVIANPTDVAADARISDLSLPDASPEGAVIDALGGRTLSLTRRSVRLRLGPWEYAVLVHREMPPA